MWQCLEANVSCQRVKLGNPVSELYYKTMWHHSTHWTCLTGRRRERRESCQPQPRHNEQNPAGSTHQITSDNSSSCQRCWWRHIREMTHCDNHKHSLSYSQENHFFWNLFLRCWWWCHACWRPSGYEHNEAQTIRGNKEPTEICDPVQNPNPALQGLTSVGSPVHPKLLQPLVLFIHQDCCGVICGVLEISAGI